MNTVLFRFSSQLCLKLYDYNSVCFLTWKEGQIHLFFGTTINRYSLFLITPPAQNNSNEEVEGNELPVRIIF